jgi:tetratricopeptide (TPR) repeat protein
MALLRRKAASIFEASSPTDLIRERMYKKKFTQWGLRKHANRADWLAFAKLYEQGRISEQPEVFIEIHNRVRAIAHLRRYLKNTNEFEGEFFVEAMKSQTMIPQHVCYADDPSTDSAAPKHEGHTLSVMNSSNAEALPMFLSSSPIPGRGSFHSRSKDHEEAEQHDWIGFAGFQNASQAVQPQQPTIVLSEVARGKRKASTEMDSYDFDGFTGYMSVAGFVKDSNDLNKTETSTFSKGFSELPNFNHMDWTASKTGFGDQNMSFPDLTEGSHMKLRPETSAKFVLKQPIATAIAPSLWREEYPGSWTMMAPAAMVNSPDAMSRIIEMSNAMGTPYMETDHMAGEDLPLSQRPGYSSQSPGHSNLAIKYITVCMFACMLGSAGRHQEFDQLSDQAASYFEQMCNSDSPLTLTATAIVLSWLNLHAQELALCKAIIGSTRSTATAILGNENSISCILSWMCSASAKALHQCDVTTSMLHNIWTEFKQTHGKRHGHTIVALYCLCFHLMRVEKAYAAAEAYLEELMAIAPEMSGLLQLQLISILATLSRAQSRQGKYDAALRSIDQCISRAKSMGRNHPLMLELLVRKALILCNLGDSNEAEHLYWIVTKGRVATLPRRHAATQKAYSGLEKVLQRNGRLESASGELHTMMNDPKPDAVEYDEYVTWFKRGVEANCPTTQLIAA